MRLSLTSDHVVLEATELTDEYTRETFISKTGAFHKNLFKVGHVYRTNAGKRFVVTDKDETGITIEYLSTHQAVNSTSAIDEALSEIVQRVRETPKTLPVAINTLKKAKLAVVKEFHKALLEEEGISGIEPRDADAVMHIILLTGVEARSQLNVPEYKPEVIVRELLREPKRNKVINKLLSLFM